MRATRVIQTSGPYSSRVIVRARALRDAGWSVQKVRDLIAQEFGRRPTEQTVRGWLDEGYASKRRRLVRTAHRRSREITPNRKLSDDWKRERMAMMLERGLSPEHIGEVAGLWWGEPMTGDEVRDRLGLMRRAA
jgi:hypothetical protein